MKVASFNIRVGHSFDGIHSWPFRRYAATKTIKDLDCDILGLQEALSFQIRFIEKRLDLHDFVGDGRKGSNDGEHCPIFYNSTKMNVLESDTKWYGATPDNPSKIPGSRLHRIYTYAKAALIDGATISVFNTHFDEKSNERRQISMDQLLGQVDLSVPTIVMGDFNAERSNKIFENIEKFGLRFAHDENCGGTINGFSRETKPRTIDHILVSKHFEVVSAEVTRKRFFGLLPSDHWPVVAQLQLK